MRKRMSIMKPVYDESAPLAHRSFHCQCKLTSLRAKKTEVFMAYVHGTYVLVNINIYIYIYIHNTYMYIHVLCMFKINCFSGLLIDLFLELSTNCFESSLQVGVSWRAECFSAVRRVSVFAIFVTVWLFDFFVVLWMADGCCEWLWLGVFSKETLVKGFSFP